MIILFPGSSLVQRRQWHPTPVLLPGKSPGWRSLVGYSPWGHKESDMTELLHFPLSCIGEGNGNPLQCSYLENPRDRGAWRAAVYGVTQSWTWLKRLSSSSSKDLIMSQSSPKELMLKKYRAWFCSSVSFWRWNSSPCIVLKSLRERASRVFLANMQLFK